MLCIAVKGIIGYEGLRNIFEDYARLPMGGRTSSCRTQIPRTKIPIEDGKAKMGCLADILRPVLALVLGVVVFFGFLFLLLFSNFSDKLLNSEFYTDTISGEDTYNRVYAEVLLDPELLGTTQDLLGDIQVISQEEIVRLLRQIVPSAYLQTQVEGSIQRTVDYFNGDSDTLEIYVEFGPPLGRIKPVLFQYIDKRIDGLVLQDLGGPKCTPERVNQLADGYASRWSDLAAGKVPQTIPSLESLHTSCRSLIFDVAFATVVPGSSLNYDAKAGLRAIEVGIRRKFVVEGDTHGVLKLAARPLATPLMDDAIDRIKLELDGQDRLDVIHHLAQWNDDFTEAELRDDIETSREWLNRGRTDLWKPAPWVMLIAGSIIMGLIHYPSLKNALRWPGVTLFLTGLVFFIAGKVAESRVPHGLQGLVERTSNGTSGVPNSVTDLGGDLLVSFGEQLTSGIDGPALTLLIIGALFVGASFFAFLLGPLFLPVATSRLALRVLGILRAAFRRRGCQPPAQGSGGIDVNQAP